MFRLHYYPSNASMIPHILLEEMGLAFELVLVDRTQQAQKSADYLKLNPNGLVPTLIETQAAGTGAATHAASGDLVLYETAAICLHLSDTHPDKHLAPPLGTPERAQFYKWLMWLTNTFQPAITMYYYPERYVAAGNQAGAQEVKARAQEKIGGLLEQLDDELARVTLRSTSTEDLEDSEHWFMGRQYTLLDPYVFTLCRWTRGFTDKPARSYEHLGPYLQRMLARPAVQRVIASENLTAPLV
jgi:glutathione S-transferase